MQAVPALLQIVYLSWFTGITGIIYWNYWNDLLEYNLLELASINQQDLFPAF